MNEALTRAELIDPKLKNSDWGVAEDSKILREYHITAGKLNIPFASFPGFLIYQLFKVLPNSVVHSIKRHDKIFGWFSICLGFALLFLVFRFGALGSHLYEMPNPDLLFGTFFKELKCYKNIISVCPKIPTKLSFRPVCHQAGNL